MTDLIPSTVSVGGERITAPLPDEVQEAISRWHDAHHEELVALLEPYGFHPYAIVAPVFRRVVTPEELRAELGEGSKS